MLGAEDKGKGAKRDTKMEIIDVHRHCLTKPLEGLMRTILEKRIHWREVGQHVVTTFKGISSIIYPELMDIEAQMRCQDQAGITRSLLSFSMAFETSARALPVVPENRLARRLNDATHAIVDRYPDKLDFMAMVNPFNRDCVKECDRCIDKLGAKGINISTSWNGKFLDSPKLNYFWEFVQQKGVAVFLHPPQVPVGHEYMNSYKLEEMVGRPFNTTMTVAWMIYAGVFDRYPNLKIILSHMGGALAMVVGRLDFGFRLGYKGLPKDQIPICKRKPSDYFRRNLYVDTMGFSPLGIKHAIELFGVDRVLFGSDYAAVPISPKEHVDIVKSLDLFHEDEEKILWKNANTLFRII